MRGYLFGWLVGGALMDVPAPGPITVETACALD